MNCQERSLISLVSPHGNSPSQKLVEGWTAQKNDMRTDKELLGKGYSKHHGLEHLIWSSVSYPGVEAQGNRLWVKAHAQRAQEGV